MPDGDRLRAVLLGRLESLERAGVMQLPRCRRPAPTPAPAAPVTVAAPATASVATESAPQSLSAVEPLESPPTAPEELIAESNPRIEESQMAKSSAWKRASGALFEAADGQTVVSTAATLSVLQQEVASCTRCSELASQRTQTVFGVGNPKARLCFMGEAPGADEDRLGEPFVGRAGQLLNRIIEACRLKREDVYILNMIKCRPPGNRNPLPTELANCRPFLERQLELIEPEYICCLGAVASQNLLNTTTPIGKLRGKLHEYRGAKVVCTFHPAYLLRNPAAKKDAWDDMKYLMRQMGVEL